jgi:hypothetical protein
MTKIFHILFARHVSAVNWVLFRFKIDLSMYLLWTFMIVCTYYEYLWMHVPIVNITIVCAYNEYLWMYVPVMNIYVWMYISLLWQRGIGFESLHMTRQIGLLYYP